VHAIPAAFVADVVRGRGDEGQAWLDRVPQLLADACVEWELVVDSPPMHGAQGLVWPVRRDQEPLVLKITWPGEMTRLEAAALIAWSGRGAVRLLDHRAEDGLLLLERLDAGRTLEHVPIGQAVVAAAAVLRRLSVPAPVTVPTLAAAARRMTLDLPRSWAALGEPFPRRVLDVAMDIARGLGPSSARMLVDRDLHYGNVLAGHREPWLAIDPMPIAGDREYGIARLLWRRFDDEGPSGLARRLDTIIDVAGLDVALARSWTLVHCVDYWLWALGTGLTEDPARCDAITGWLLTTRRW
jgi:streptomycin 6-kinase